MNPLFYHKEASKVVNNYNPIITIQYISPEDVVVLTMIFFKWASMRCRNLWASASLGLDLPPILEKNPTENCKWGAKLMSQRNNIKIKSE